MVLSSPRRPIKRTADSPRLKVMSPHAPFLFILEWHHSVLLVTNIAERTLASPNQVTPSYLSLEISMSSFNVQIPLAAIPLKLCDKVSPFEPGLRDFLEFQVTLRPFFPFKPELADL